MPENYFAESRAGERSRRPTSCPASALSPDKMLQCAHLLLCRRGSAIASASHHDQLCRSTAPRSPGPQLSRATAQMRFVDNGGGKP
jgi:hypothetical protein